MTDQKMMPETALESWKEIAAHLRRDVRTAKRWEKSEGLPVRRHLHQARSSVYAYPSELDTWWAARAPALSRRQPASGRRVASRAAFAAALALAIATPSSGPPVSARSATQRTGPSLTEIFSEVQLDSSGRFSPDGRSLTGIENGSVIVIDVETGQRRLVTAGDWNQPPYAFALGPIWSRDGRRIAYAWVTGEQSEARIVPAAGGPSEIFFNGNFFPADWAANGRQIVGWLMKRDGRVSLALVSDRGEVTELRTWTDILNGPSMTARFSADDRYVAYGATVGTTTSIAVIDVATRNETVLTRAPHSERFPVWSPDGGSLLFVSDRSGQSDVWLMAIADGRPAGDARLAYSDIGDVRGMVGWDGHGRLVFTRRVSFGQLYVIGVDGASGTTIGAPERPVRLFEGKHMLAVWSPSGDRLAIQAATRERGAMYVISGADEQARELPTRELGWTRTAGWLPSGDAIAVSSSRGGDFALHVIPVAGGRVETVYTDHETNWASAQLSPDGTAFVGSVGDTARIIDLERKQTIREMTLQPGEGYHGFAWAPDGKAVFAIAGQRVVRIPVPSGEPHTIASGGFRSLAVSPDGLTLALTRFAEPAEDARLAERPYELYVAGTKDGRLTRVALPDGHRPWRVRWAGPGRIAYISNMARSQFVRLSDFMPARR